MTALTYQELVSELFPRLTGGIRWGLDRTERLLGSVGDPHRRYRSLHVGGTNGKGSVAATLDSVLRAAGHRTGLYTSPHLCTFRERIQIDGRALGEAELVRAAGALWPTIQHEQPSFFEATTAIAFEAFAEAGVEVAVVEVGLGGRLDATNVVAPEVAVVTNVALDHAEYLGDTLEAIATEKAGIIKAGVPVVTAERDPAVLENFRRRAESVGAPFRPLDFTRLRDVRVGTEGTRFRWTTEGWGVLDLHTPLIGAHQAVNAALAIHALETLPKELRPTAAEIVDGVARVRWPGRLQRVRTAGGTWIFDAAHNPAGVDALAAALRAVASPRPVIALVGILSDKDWATMLQPLLRMVDGVVLTTAPTAPEHRRWDLEGVLSVVAPRVAPGMARAVPDFAEALAVAVESARGGTVLVTGSFHTVGDAMCALELAPDGCDSPLPGSTPGA